MTFYRIIENVPNGTSFSSVQSLSHVRLLATPWIAARQASLSITNSRSSLRLTSIESVMPSSHLTLCHPLLLLPPIPPSIRVFSNESTLHIAMKFFSTIFNTITSLVLASVYFPVNSTLLPSDKVESYRSLLSDFGISCTLRNHRMQSQSG